MAKQVPPVVAALSARLSQIGFERTRRAVAALALSVFVSLYLVVALNAPEGLGAALVALSICYGVAFMGVVAEWFWGRWFASGLGWSGVMVAIAATAMIGWTPVLAIYGALHALVVVLLLGKKMAARYDLQEAWRQRYNMDEFGVERLRKTVTRAVAALPSLILWALGRREDGMGFAVTGVAALAFATLGLRGLVKMRSWGVLAIGAAALVVAATGHVGTAAFAPDCACRALASAPAASATLALMFLVAAVVPFVGPTARYLRRRA